MIDRDPRRRAPQSAPPKIEAVATASAIIDFLAEAEQPQGVQQIADALGMTKSRVSRHMANLEALGLASRLTQGRGFRLGWRVVRWGQIGAGRQNLSALLDPVLQALNRETGRTVLLCAPAGGDAIVAKCLPATTAIRIDVSVGLVLSLPHSPSARIAYAFQPREWRREMLAHLKQREPDFRVENEEIFTRQIADIHRLYYCWDSNKYNIGYGAIAAPVFGQDEALVAIVALIMPSEELSGPTPPPSLIDALMRRCQEGSFQLGSKMRYPCTHSSSYRNA